VGAVNEIVRFELLDVHRAMIRVRVPGFLLRGDQVVSTQTLMPRDYERLWKQHDLNRYPLQWAALRGEKRCLHCLAKLADSAGHRRMYCSEKRHNA
jgi:hypothetical protein